MSHLQGQRFSLRLKYQLQHETGPFIEMCTLMCSHPEVYIYSVNRQTALHNPLLQAAVQYHKISQIDRCNFSEYKYTFIIKPVLVFLQTIMETMSYLVSSQMKH